MIATSRMKATWATCEQLAEKLGTTKSVVFNRLYARLKAENRIALILGGDDGSIAIAKSYLHEESQHQPRIHEPEARNSFQDLKLALWFADKVGGVKRAQRLTEAIATLDVENL